MDQSPAVRHVPGGFRAIWAADIAGGIVISVIGCYPAHSGRAGLLTLVLAVTGLQSGEPFVVAFGGIFGYRVPPCG